MKQENRSSKTLKGQLLGAISMMLVAAIALGTSTYAWFINNQAVEVQEMNLTVSTSTSLLVALEKQAANTWTGYKSAITNADIKSAEEGGWTNFLTNQITPASVSSYSLMQATPAFYATDNHVTNSKLDQFALLTAGTGDTHVGQGPVKKLGLKFLASNDVSVYLGQNALDNIANMITPKHVKTQTEIDKLTSADKTNAQTVFDNETAQATAVKAALRVAVVSQNNAYEKAPASGPYKGGKVVTFQFDMGLTGMAGNNTDYKYTTQHFTSETDNTTNVAITGGDVSTQINETTGKYAAVMTVDSPAKHVTATQILQATLPTAAGTGYLATVDPSNTVTAPAATPAVLFDLVANEPREVDVYIWLEGTDNECLNSLSGYNFNLVVPFAAVTKVAP